MKTRLMTAAFAVALCMLCRADAPAVNDVWTEGDLSYTVTQDADESLYLTLTGSSVSTNGAVVIPAELTRSGTTLRVRGYGKDVAKNFRGVALTLPSEIFAHPDANGLKPTYNPGVTNLVVFKSRNDELYTIPSSFCIENNDLQSLSLAGICCLTNTSSNSGGAFSGRSKLKYVSLGDDMEYIGSASFSGCNALAAPILPASLRRIGQYAFYNCTNISDIVFTPGVCQIDNCAFGYCKGLREIELPSTVTNVHGYAFVDCKGLTNYTLHVEGNRVTGRFPFECDNLSIKIVGDGEATIAPYAFTTPVSYYKVKATALTLIGVKAIEGTTGANSPFKGAEIGTVTMDDSMLDIGDYAFYWCALGSIAMSGSVTNIGRNAFNSISALTNIVIGAGVRTIGQSAFSSSRNFPEIILPDSVTNVENNAFTACDAVTNLVIGSGLKRIENNRFPQQSAMAVTVNGDGDAVVADGAFISSYIRKVTLNGVKYIGNENLGSSGAFAYCDRLKSVNFGEGLEQVGKMSFYQCYSLGSVAFPASLRRIGPQAFTSCTNLTSVTFGSGVGQIDSDAFYCCTGLTDVEIPANVTNISGTAFANCTGITNFVIRNAGGRITAAWIPRNCEASVSIIGDGETTIAPKAFYESSWSALYKVNVNAVSLSGVKAIENATTVDTGAFHNLNIATVDMDSTLRDIGGHAFARSELEYINIPGSVTNIGERAFYDCEKLRRVRLGEGVESIGSAAFSLCSRLKYVEIPGTVRKIGYGAFSSIKSLTLVFKGPPPEGLSGIALSKGATIVRPNAYAAEWEGVTVANAKIIPEPVEGVTWNANTDRDWANLPGVAVHSGMVAADETWAADALHVVNGWVTVTNGVTLTVEPGAVVKFCPGMGVYVMPYGALKASGATFTHIRDDAIAGDTDADSGLVKPIAGDYTILGYIEDADEPVWRCRLFRRDGTLEADTVWTGGGNVYYIDGDVTVPQNISLSITQGAIVKVEGEIYLHVNGTLTVSGTRQEPVYFTSYRDDSVGGDSDGADAYPVEGDWGYIDIQTKGSATLEHVVLRYGGGDSRGEHGVGTKAVIQSYGETRLSGCTFSDTYNRAVIGYGKNNLLTVENCVFCNIGTSISMRPVAKLFGGVTVFRNCLFNNCQSISETSVYFTERPSFHNCIFQSFQRWFGNRNDSVESVDDIVFSHCCFWDRRDGSDVCPMANTNGNILANPLLANAEGEDWRIAAASPCVDAADAYAPARDAYGQPRQNVSTSPTGVKNASGRYADIGVYEVIPLAGAADAPDLEVFDIATPESMTVGETATISYKVCNVSDANDELGTVRYDRVELVAANGTVHEVFRAARPASRIACRRGTILSESAMFTVPALSLGLVRVRVTVNCERDIFEGVMYDNNTAQSDSVTLAAPEVGFDAFSSGALTLPAGGSYACRLSGEQATERLLVLRGSAGSVISARTATGGAMPTASSFATQAAAVGGDAYILVVPEGEVSVAIDNNGGSLANISIQNLGSGLVLFDPNTVVTSVNTNFLYKNTRKYVKGVVKDYREIATGSSANPYGMPKGLYLPAESGGRTTYVGVDTNAMRIVQIRIWGNGFTDGMTAALVSGGNRIEAQSLNVYSSTSAYAEFEYYGREPGNYALVVSDGGANASTGTRFALWDPIAYYLSGDQELRLLPADPDKVEVSVSKFPQALRGGRIYTGSVSWRNKTGKDLDAPYLRLAANNVRIRLNESAQWNTKFDFVALSASSPYDKIKPGEERSLTFQVIAPDENGYISVPLSLNTAQKGTQEGAKASDWQSGRGTSGRGRSLKHGVRLRSFPGKPKGAAAADGTEPYPWDQNEPFFRPADMNDELWALVWSQLRTLYGETWGSYVARMRSRAAAVAGSYVKPPPAVDPDRIIAADLSKMLSADFFCGTMAEWTDLNRLGLGFPLRLTRSYSSSLQARMSDGLFGRGWYSPFDMRLVQHSDLNMTIASPGGEKTRYIRASTGSVWQDTGSRGRSTVIEGIQFFKDGSFNAFASDGLFMGCRDANGNGVTLTRDNSRRIIRAQHTGGMYFTFEYVGDSPVPSRIVDDLGEAVTYTYAVSDGVYLLTSVTTAQETMNYSYREADATAASRALVRISGTVTQPRDFAWDGSGRITSITKCDQFITEYIRETDDRVRVVAPGGRVCIYDFTPFMQTLSITGANGGVSRWEYEDGKYAPVACVYPSGKRVAYEYNAAGDLVQITRASGRTVKYTYDDARQPTQISYSGSARTYTYDERGRQTVARGVSGRSMSFTYSENGEVASEVYADGAHGWNYEYATNGEMSAVISVDGKLRYNYERDAAGRIVRASVVRKKDAAAAAVVASSSPRLLGAPMLRGGDDDEEETSEQNMVYNAKGQLVQYTSGEHTITITYDEQGRRSSLVDEDGDGQRYTYDSIGRLSQIIDAKDDSNVHVTYEYDDLNGGCLRKKTFADGMVTGYAYDLSGHTTQVVSYRGTEKLSDFRYDYDVDGNLVQSRNTVTGERNDFTYDEDGNIEKIVYVDSEGVMYDTDNDVAKVSVVLDDSTGNAKTQKTDDGTWTCLYDEFNNLVEMHNEDGSKSASYHYDAFGNVDEETVNGSTKQKVFLPGTKEVVSIYKDGKKTHVITTPDGEEVGSEEDDDDSSAGGSGGGGSGGGGSGAGGSGKKNTQYVIRDPSGKKRNGNNRFNHFPINHNNNNNNNNNGNNGNNNNSNTNNQNASEPESPSDTPVAQKRNESPKNPKVDPKVPKKKNLDAAGNNKDYLINDNDGRIPRWDNEDSKNSGKDGDSQQQQQQQQQQQKDKEKSELQKKKEAMEQADKNLAEAMLSLKSDHWSKLDYFQQMAELYREYMNAGNNDAARQWANEKMERATIEAIMGMIPGLSNLMGKIAVAQAALAAAQAHLDYYTQLAKCTGQDVSNQIDAAMAEVAQATQELSAMKQRVMQSIQEASDLLQNFDWGDYMDATRRELLNNINKFKGLLGM